MTAPADRLRRVLLRHCSAATMERLVDPILADIHVEASAAAARGHRWTSRRIRAAGVMSLVTALALHGWMRFWRVQEWPANDRQALARTLAYSAAATAVAITLLMMPPLLRFPVGRALGLAPYLMVRYLLHLVPQVLPHSLAVGLLIGLFYGLNGRGVGLAPRAAIVLVSVLCSIASFVALLTWANQGHYPLRWGLAAAPVVAPVVLTFWALLVVARLPDRRWVVGIVVIASCVAYYSLVWTAHGAVLRRALPPVAGAWLPNAAFVAAIALLTRRTPNDERRTAAASL